MEAVKGESVLWTKSSIGFVLLMFSFISSMTFFIWSISSFTVCEVVPLNCLYLVWVYLLTTTSVCHSPSLDKDDYFVC